MQRQGPKTKRFALSGSRYNRIFTCKSLGVTGSGLFVIHNCMNHSCDPNAVSLSQEKWGRLTVRARKEIKKGEEIRISYIDETLRHDS